MLLRNSGKDDKRKERYENIKRTLKEKPSDVAALWKYFQQWYPGYDPDGIAPQVEAVIAQQERRTENKQQAETQRIREQNEHFKTYRDKLRALTNVTTERLLPRPFEWVKIRAESYSVSQRPITRKQFDMFINSGGYTQKQWWTTDGWEAAQKGWEFHKGDWYTVEAWKQPYHDERWSKNPDAPIIGISWHEAVAFTLWLSDFTGEKISIPTVKQWALAANTRAIQMHKELEWARSGKIEDPNSAVAISKQYEKGIPHRPYQRQFQTSFRAIRAK